MSALGNILGKNSSKPCPIKWMTITITPIYIFSYFLLLNIQKPRVWIKNWIDVSCNLESTSSTIIILIFEEFWGRDQVMILQEYCVIRSFHETKFKDYVFHMSIYIHVQRYIIISGVTLHLPFAFVCDSSEGLIINITVSSELP